MKSDKIDTQTPAKARATARAYVEQAIRNSRHLADGESIVISFARMPSKEVQDAMNEVFFSTNGSQVSEVRYGTATLKRADYKPPAPTPAKKQSAKTSRKKATAPLVDESDTQPAGDKPTSKPATDPPTAKKPPTDQPAPPKLPTKRPPGWSHRQPKTEGRKTATG